MCMSFGGRVGGSRVCGTGAVCDEDEVNAKAFIACQQKVAEASPPGVSNGQSGPFVSEILLMCTSTLLVTTYLKSDISRFGTFQVPFLHLTPPPNDWEKLKKVRENRFDCTRQNTARQTRGKTQISPALSGDVIGCDLCPFLFSQSERSAILKKEIFRHLTARGSTSGSRLARQLQNCLIH